MSVTPSNPSSAPLPPASGDRSADPLPAPVRNKPQELTLEYVAETNRHVYLTGRAGTGKTTLLHHIRREVKKHMAIVAPTGVAAINAGGQTIHSVFQLPFGFIAPGQPLHQLRKLSARKTELLRAIDLLVIDEISMVRADVLDAIDRVLRRVRGDRRPFGGLQLLMIGDLHQLPPIVTEEERTAVTKHYPTPYFFASHALTEATYVRIELQHVYRQRDRRFLELLHHVRTNDLPDNVLRELNRRYRPDLNPADAEGYITLTSHNSGATRINREKLGRLTTPLHRFRARVENNFPARMYPNNPELSLRVGAQVMFNRNDTTSQQYYNGKIGRIVAINDQVVEVRCPGDARPIAVTPVTWENVEQRVKDEGVGNETLGSYTQHPLRLAWAITIHKSQGLTFERVVIDAGSAFAHGQVYVALSRCKTLEGIILHSRIRPTSVRTDGIVTRHTADNVRLYPTPAELENDKRSFQATALRDFLQLQPLLRATAACERTFLEHDRSIQGDGHAAFRPLQLVVHKKLIEPARHLASLLKDWGEPRQNTMEAASQQSRLRAGAVYFTGVINGQLRDQLAAFTPLSDNQKVRKEFTQHLRTLRREVAVLSACCQVLLEDYEALTLLAERTAAGLRFDEQQRHRQPTTRSLPTEPPANADLYQHLVEWRLAQATEKNAPAYTVAHNATLLEIARRLPTSRADLLAIPKIGPKTCSLYGKDILEIVGLHVAAAEQLAKVS